MVKADSKIGGGEKVPPRRRRSTRGGMVAGRCENRLGFPGSDRGDAVR